jgi:hypothetical protein
MAHCGITSTASFMRDDCMTHDLQLNSQGKRRLTHLITELIRGGGDTCKAISIFLLLPMLESQIKSTDSMERIEKPMRYSRSNGVLVKENG